MLQKISSVFVVYRRKTLTGSPDPTHANGMDKPCIGSGLVVGKVYISEFPCINLTYFHIRLFDFGFNLVMYFIV